MNIFNFNIHIDKTIESIYKLWRNRKTFDEKISNIEESIKEIRYSYKSSSRFYDDFDSGKWMMNIKLNYKITSRLGRKICEKYLKSLDLSISYDWSNIQLMMLQLVAKSLKKKEIDIIVSSNRISTYGGDQSAGLCIFLQYINEKFPKKMSDLARSELEKLKK